MAKKKAEKQDMGQGIERLKEEDKELMDSQQLRKDHEEFMDEGRFLSRLLKRFRKL